MNDLQLMHEVVKLALTAGEAILPFWRADVAVTNKADDSPVTAADLAAHRVIADGLLALAPHIPVLSEEDCNIPLAERQGWSRWWLVDPLDGTKEFIAGSEEFTVNIALVYAPPRSEGDQGRIETGYQRLCQPICDLLIELGGDASVGEIDGAFCDGRYNVNLNGRKLVGTAQRWRQGLGGKRPVVLVHGALLLDNQRESMVAAVNRFNECCELEQRCRADAHIALHEVAPAAPWFERLSQAYAKVLADLPKD